MVQLQASTEKIVILLTDMSPHYSALKVLIRLITFLEYISPDFKNAFTTGVCFGELILYKKLNSHFPFYGRALKHFGDRRTHNVVFNLSLR